MRLNAVFANQPLTVDAAHIQTHGCSRLFGFGVDVSSMYMIVLKLHFGQGLHDGSRIAR